MVAVFTACNGLQFGSYHSTILNTYCVAFAVCSGVVVDLSFDVADDTADISVGAFNHTARIDVATAYRQNCTSVVGITTRQNGLFRIRDADNAARIGLAAICFDLSRAFERAMLDRRASQSKRNDAARHALAADGVCTHETIARNADVCNRGVFCLGKQAAVRVGSNAQVADHTVSCKHVRAVFSLNVVAVCQIIFLARICLLLFCCKRGILHHMAADESTFERGVFSADWKHILLIKRCAMRHAACSGIVVILTPFIIRSVIENRTLRIKVITLAFFSASVLACESISRGLCCGHIDRYDDILIEIVCAICKFDILLVKIIACFDKGLKSHKIDAVFDDIGVELIACGLLYILTVQILAVTFGSHCKAVFGVKRKHCKLRQATIHENISAVCSFNIA